MNANAHQAKALFLDLIGHVPPEEWDQRLAAACGDDESLRCRVQALLRAHREPDSFLEEPAIVRDAEFRSDPPAPEGPGAQIGPYKLLEQIGEGGFGVVYMAERQESVRRKVALKVLKPGMDTRQIVARFEVERQALALMDHPNIARVFDGGTTPSGRPYFVMELVKGTPITDYCDRHCLTPRHRLELFVAVCQAVQHAHQKGIIHRDLKPGNVLVTVQDTQPLVKVIDFGVAKALGQELTDKTLFTGFAQMVGTPLYMSPEQAGQSGLDIDTRTDIYALGVLLYEMLTGTTPFEKSRFQKAAYDEMRRIILEEEPPKPSTRVSTLANQVASAISERRSELKRLSHTIRGELDWVVMKALEKDRNRRYDSATGFAADVKRYLNDEPVQACPPSAAYRIRKFARRNRNSIVLAIAVLFLLAGAGIGIGRGEWDRWARRSAVERAVLQALAQSDAYTEARSWPAALAEARRACAALTGGAADDRLRRRVERHLVELELVTKLEQVRTRVKTRSAAGEAFDYRGADLEYGDTFRRFSLGLSDIPSMQRIHCRNVRVELAAALDDWAAVRQRIGESESWTELLDAARAIDSDPWRDRLRLAWVSKDAQVLEQLASSAPLDELSAPTLVLLGRTLIQGNLEPQAFALLREVHRKYPNDFWINYELAASAHALCEYDISVRFYTAAMVLRPDNAGVRNDLGLALQNSGRLDEAIEELRGAIQLEPDLALAHSNLGSALMKKGLRNEALDAFREALRVKPDYCCAHHHLGTALSRLGRHAEAVAACREAVRLDPEHVEAHFALGAALKEHGLRDEAISEFREVVRLEPNHAHAHHEIGIALREKHILDEAAMEFREAIRIDPHEAVFHMNLGATLFEQGAFDEAVLASRKAVEINPQLALAWNNLGNALRRQGQMDDALAALQEAVEIDPRLGMAWHNLGLALMARNELDEAVDSLRKAVRLEPKKPEHHIVLGILFGKQGRWAEAEAVYRQALRVAPQSHAAHGLLGTVLHKRGELELAANEFRKAIQIRQNVAADHYNLGIVLDALGRHAEALAALDRAIRLQPDHAETVNRLVALLTYCPRAELRNPDRALELARRAVELSPESPWSWQLLGWAEYRAGNWGAAIDPLEKSCKLQPGGAGDHGQWIVLALAHARLAQQKDPTEANEAFHRAEARRWYGKAMKATDGDSSPDEALGAIREFRAEAAALFEFF